MLMWNKTENPCLLTLICSPLSLSLSLSLSLWLELHMARILIAPHDGELDILSASGSPFENGLLPGNKLAPPKEFSSRVWNIFLVFSPHEPSMWPPLSMRISTSERAFFGFASTWHRPVSKLLAITPMCFGKLGTCFFWKRAMGDAPSFCGPLHLYPVSVRELIVCRTGVFFLVCFFQICQPWQLEYVFTL